MPLPWHLAGRMSAAARPASSSKYLSSSVSRQALRQQQLHQQRRAYSSPPPPQSGSSIKFWPFAVIAGIGFAGYAGLAQNRRKGERSSEHTLEAIS
jgi:hypothetical protein